MPTSLRRTWLSFHISNFFSLGVIVTFLTVSILLSIAVKKKEKTKPWIQLALLKTKNGIIQIPVFMLSVFHNYMSFLFRLFLPTYWQWHKLWARPYCEFPASWQCFDVPSDNCVGGKKKRLCFLFLCWFDLLLRRWNLFHVDSEFRRHRVVSSMGVSKSLLSLTFQLIHWVIDTDSFIILFQYVFISQAKVKTFKLLYCFLLSAYADQQCPNKPD